MDIATHVLIIALGAFVTIGAVSFIFTKAFCIAIDRALKHNEATAQIGGRPISLAKSELDASIEFQRHQIQRMDELRKDRLGSFSD